jgi:L-lactate permease
MLSPQNLTIAVAAVKLGGQEGVLLRKAPPADRGR